MEFKFEDDIEEMLCELVYHATKKHINVYIVGGAVRNAILGCYAKDYDLIIEGNALEFVKNLPKEFEVISTYDDFYTAKLAYKNLIFDLSSTRTEHYEKMGCLPKIIDVGVDIATDVVRRDFTVNSLYCKLVIEDNSIKYKIIDLLSGLEDIKDRKLKVLHYRSYIDDPTRILRGMSLKYRYGFEFDSKNLGLIEECLKSIDYGSISIGRFTNVFIETLSYKPMQMFKEAIENKYYKLMQPGELEVNYPKIYKCIDMFHLNNAEQAEFFIKIMQNENCEIADLELSIDIFKHFAKYGSKSNLAYYFYRTNDPNLVKYLSMKGIILHTTGDDLLELGYKQGRLFKLIFNKLLEEKLKTPDKLKTKKDELKYITSVFHI